MACDVCGCGANNSTQGLGTLSQGNRTGFGMNYQYRHYHSVHQGLFGGPNEESDDYFQRWDILAQIRLSKKWQIRVDIPISNNIHKADEGITVVNGIGDASITGNYFLIDKEDSLKTKRFRWIVGLGVKSPIGKFTEPNDENVFLMPGTGTFDALMQNSFFLQKNKWSFVQQTNLMIRGENKFNYRPGNQFSATAFVQRKLFSSLGLFAGGQYSWSGKDYINRKAKVGSPTEGIIVTGIAGVSYSFNSFLFQGNMHIPIYQLLGEGNSNQNLAFTLSFTYFLD